MAEVFASITYFLGHNKPHDRSILIGSLGICFGEYLANSQYASITIMDVAVVYLFCDGMYIPRYLPNKPKSLWTAPIQTNPGARGKANARCALCVVSASFLFRLSR